MAICSQAKYGTKFIDAHIDIKNMTILLALVCVERKNAGLNFKMDPFKAYHNSYLEQTRKMIYVLNIYVNHTLARFF